MDPVSCTMRLESLLTIGLYIRQDASQLWARFLFRPVLFLFLYDFTPQSFVLIQKFRKPPPLLTNSIQVLEMDERGRWRVQQTELQPPSQKRSVALECFGLSKVRCAGYLSASQIRAQAPKGTASGCRRICLTGSDQSEDQPDKFLGRMRYGNVVMFPFSLFLCQVCGKSRVPVADEAGGIEQSETEIVGASFLHVRISIIQFARLVCGWRQPGISQNLVG